MKPSKIYPGMMIAILHAHRVVPAVVLESPTGWTKTPYRFIEGTPNRGSVAIARRINAGMDGDPEWISDVVEAVSILSPWEDYLKEREAERLRVEMARKERETQYQIAMRDRDLVMRKLQTLGVGALMVDAEKGFVALSFEDFLKIGESK